MEQEAGGVLGHLCVASNSLTDFSWLISLWLQASASLIWFKSLIYWGFPGGSNGKESACNAETWVRSLGWEDPLEKERLPTPIFWPGEFHGQRSLVSYSP